MTAVQQLLIMFGLLFGAYTTFAAGYYIQFTKSDLLNQTVSAGFYVAGGCLTMVLILMLVTT